MKYKAIYGFSISRQLQIVNKIAKAEEKLNTNAEIKALMALLKIDRTQETEAFLKEFRNLKKEHQFIDDLCQSKGFFGSIGYAIRSSSYREHRYKTIVNEIITYLNDDLRTTTLDYFHIGHKLRPSLRSEVESAQNDYLKKIYPSTNDPDYKNDRQIFVALKIFNGNMEYSTDTYQNSDTQHLNTKNITTWEEFINRYPEYSVIDATNQNSPNININGIAINKLREKIVRSFQLPPETLLFIDGRRNEQINSIFAANTIGRCWKNYVRINYTQQQRLVDMKAKRALEDLMIMIGKYFKKVPTAEEVNGQPHSCNTHKMRQTLPKSIEKERFGNCNEQAQLLYHLIQNSPILADEVKKQTSVVQLTKPDDHVFVVIGDINSDDALVLDPWLKFVDFKPVNEYRKTSVKNMDKRRGFLGSKAQYLKFLASHEDGTYIKKNHSHQIERSGLSNEGIYSMLSINIHKQNR